MAEPSTSSVECQNILVDWVGIHGSDDETRHLCHGKPATSREVKLEIYFDPVSSFGFFKLRAPVDVEGEIMPLFLHIKPDRITSLIYTGSKGTTNTMPHLRFTLGKPAELIVPFGDSLPLKRPKLDGSTLTSLKQLAQETTLCVYMAHDQMLSETLLQPLCAAVTDRSLKPLKLYSELSGLYRGRGAKVLQGAELGVPPALPSYDEVGGLAIPYPSKQSAAPTSASTKRPRLSSSDSYGNESEDIRADCWKKPVIEPGAYEQNQLACEEFSRLRDELLQMKTKVKQMEEESQMMKLELKKMDEGSQQMKAEMALIKTTTVETDSQATSETSTGKPTLSQRMRTRLDVYSKVEVEDRVHEGTLDTIVGEELCRQAEIDARFDDLEDRHDSYTKSEIDRKLEEVEQNLARELQESLCNVDDVEEILYHKLKTVYTKDETDNRLYDLEKSYKDTSSIEIEEWMVETKGDLEKDLRSEIKDAKVDLQGWMQTAVRLRMKSVKRALKLRMGKRSLSKMPPWRKFSRSRVVVKSTGSD
ncbi:hypothetical protein VPNG_02419 [Cytospora leucostoma]|uniref:Uncharacterized protein n=1 Tax=Cytospora leucostoma TaxID=1230097 RepID=A0A423XHA0_9PEZI|nr:hypothetical protein VPNG_02419 [Cytospora leucostoma]